MTSLSSLTVQGDLGGTTSARALRMTRWVLFAFALTTGCSEDPVATGDASPDGAMADASMADASIDSTARPDVATDTGPGRDAMPPPPGWCNETDTVVGQLVSSMGAGDWVELPDNPSISSIDLHDHLVTWRDNGVWNPLTRTVQWIGGPGSCCADPAAYELIVYDVANDEWSVQSTPWPDSTGHAYDGNAMDQATGVHYFARGESIQGFDGNTWTPLPDLPIQGSIAVAVTWFASLNGGAGGLVYVARSRRAALWDGSAWSDISREEEAWGTIHPFAEYNPIDRVVWMGGGNNNSNAAVRLNEDLSYTVLGPAPLNLSASGRSFKTYDPLTGVFLVRDNENDLWYEFDVMEDSWLDVTTQVQANVPATWDPDRYFGTSIDDCGVFFFFTHDFDERRAYLYKHSE